MMKGVDAFLLGRRTYLTHAAAFEPMPQGDYFGDLMNSPKKYVVSRALEAPTWRNTTIIRENVIDSVRALKSEPGGTIMTDGSSPLVHALLEHGLVDQLHLLLYPLSVGSEKKVIPEGINAGSDCCRRHRIRLVSWAFSTRPSGADARASHAGRPLRQSAMVVFARHHSSSLARAH